MPNFNQLGSYHGQGRSWWLCWGLYYDTKIQT